MIDTHSHLFEDEFKDDLDDCIKRCKDNNVNKIMIVGFSDETNAKALELSKKYDIFYPTAGVHPEEAGPDYLDKFNRLVEFIKNNKVYAIGECGLDYYWDITYKEEQKELLKLQCDLALKNDLPIIIHMREATKDTYDILKDYKGLRGVMHCYSGSYEMAKEFIKLGFYISLGGPVTFKNAKEPKLIAKEIPLEKLLIETDCPFLAPTPYRGKRNESSYVKLVCEAIAELRGISFDSVEKATEENTKELFKL
jgi:TatD DNase family protein